MNKTVEVPNYWSVSDQSGLFWILTWIYLAASRTIFIHIDIRVEKLLWNGNCSEINVLTFRIFIENTIIRTGFWMAVP